MATSFHGSAFAVKPNQPVKSSTYWVAILKSHIQPSNNLKEEDFLWIKSPGGISVKVICAQYSNKHPQEGKIHLKHGRKVPSDDTSIRQLDEHGDRLVAFEAVKTSDLPSRMAGERLPLTPKCTQVSVRAGSEDPSTKAKSEDALCGGPPKPILSKGEPRAQDENTTPDASYQPPYISPRRASVPLAPATASRLQVPGPRHPPVNSTGNQPKTPVPCDPSPITQPVTTPDVPDWATSNGFILYAEEYRPKFQARHPELNDAQITQLIHHGGWLQITPMERQIYEDAARKPAGTQAFQFQPIKAELDMKDVLPVSQVDEFPPQPETHSFQLQTILKDATPERLECSVEKGVKLLDQLKDQMSDKVAETVDAGQWIEQIDNLRKQAVKTKTIIGVVGNTGAGKSSVINALLDEERIIPTNCMRACTAVVTEISYNDTKIPYHAQIEFIQAADWERELKTLFQDLFDGSGNVSRDCSNPDTEAGIAYAKIKAVYPKKTKEDMTNSTIEKMLKEVSHILGTNREIKETDSLRFYQRLQQFVDSKEKSTGDKKTEKKEMEFWPLIRVVRIHVKSPALSTGAVVVDLPGVHDSNAARAAVAENYMKQCTGLWIVAPINRAVDDKAAKNLLGETFKRQLKMDGGFSTVTFICSKTDDISLMEAQESLGLDDEMAESWEKLDDFSKKQRSLETELKELKETKELLGATLNDADDQIEIWEDLRDSVEDGKTVYAPKSKASSKKRKGKSAKKPRKRQRRDATSDDDFLDDGDSDDNASEPDPDEELESAESREPLSEDQVVEKISELRSMKKEARRQRLEITGKLKEIEKEKREAHDAEEKIEADMAALCISGRNGYSKGAIQNDFAQGIRELDQEIAAEDDEANFNPDSDARDYEEVARSLPVFCVSSRGYQKLQGRLRKDPKVPGFATVGETEIPQLQAHCKQLTEAGRTANCKRFINNLSQLLNSLSLWASNDGTGANMTPEQRTREERYLQKGLKGLESGLDKAVVETCKEISAEFKDNIFDKYDPAIANAAQMASTTAQHWGSKVNREDRAAGGYCWSTYKAICRRNGEFSNAQGPHQWNHQLVEPMIKMLTSGWEKTSTRRLPMVMSSFVRRAANLLREFHHDVDGRARKVGAGIAGLSMLQQQLGVYETILKDLTGTVKDTINNGQKEINREFTPVIARAMIAAYEACVNESGPGSYMRMKAAMNAHVDQERHVMFQESADEVQGRLRSLVQNVEETMSNRVDEVFLAMRRDYRSVLGAGEDVQGQVLPKVQRLMRKQVIKIFEGVEEIFKKVMDGEEDEMENDEKPSESLESDTEEQTAASPPASDSESKDRKSPASVSQSRRGSVHDENESDKVVNTGGKDKETSEEEYADPNAGSPVQHSSFSESAAGQSDSDDD